MQLYALGEVMEGSNHSDWSSRFIGKGLGPTMNGSDLSIMADDAVLLLKDTSPGKHLRIEFLDPFHILRMNILQKVRKGGLTLLA